MSEIEQEKKVGWIQVFATLCALALFVADYGLDVLAKPVPQWAYMSLGLLALGVEAGALRRLLLQIIRAMARVPQDGGEK
ncbi:MAG: hypothetical protein KJ731_15785 [Alphaproteobacteria bacterium]|uniref:Uncharacterized protein n=1 Tax=viral metagenome TaxID=1070528 RepID=A0A6M3JIE4_9ZZZZ|nr:hypothetical protein [Alphaproteobacteria bacterium]MBU1277646.1 hypothetical protein [Alphaproteobacteria bacterium]MBU1574515.1 hypothetical protein [Alphaproteobacteria bacterium]MBU1829912.1 hypothetical protein [Alphaproteobacteria bacterium]MBU2079950.1 hypothetical protein [Alphaproteobacteria bacterium]